MIQYQKGHDNGSLYRGFTQPEVGHHRSFKFVDVKGLRVRVSDINDQINFRHIRNELSPAAGMESHRVLVVPAMSVPECGEHPSVALDAIRGLQKLIEEDIEGGLDSW